MKKEKFICKPTLLYEVGSQSFEEVSDELVTIQGQDITVREILLKFAQGNLDTNIQKQVYYDDNSDFDNFDICDNPAFDFVDADNYLREQRKKEVDKTFSQNNARNEGVKVENVEAISDSEAKAKSEDVKNLKE